MTRTRHFARSTTHLHVARGTTHAALAVMLLLCTLPLVAQTLDRTKVPTPGPAPALRVPAWTTSTLADGAVLIVSESHNLPIVSVQIALMGGTDQYERVDRRGVGGLTASMMSEGTKTRDAEALSNAQQLLGTSVAFGLGSEGGTISFQCTKANFAKTLDLLADMLLTSTFPPASLDRLRAQRLVNLTQAKSQPASISGRVFARVLYGDTHPFGQTATEASLKSITRDDVVQFQQSYYQPGRALITVVGDVTAAAAKAAVERALAGWAKGGDKPAFTYPSLPETHPTTISLVDKPGAAQSTFAIGNPGPPRSTPDYYALQVMNMILGGQFQSRLNANIREDKGYSYGVTSSFAFGRGPGAFKAGGDIVSAKTDAALVEFMKELRGIEGSRPITDAELTTAKDALTQRLPGTFASVQSISAAIAGLWTQGLPADYYQQYAAKIAAITTADVVRVAKQYIDLDHLAIVIVGDRATIEGPLKATGIAPVVDVDIDGNIKG